MVTDYALLLEAQAIARGLLNKPPRRAHLIALLSLLESVETAHQERAEVIGQLLAHRSCEKRTH